MSMTIDFLGKNGCCLICVEKGKCDEPCFKCRCTKCDWYVPENRKCWYPIFKKEKELIEGVKVLRETDKGALLRMDDKESWFPKSQIVIKENGVAIPRWLAEEKGWVSSDDWWELDGLSFKEFEKQRLSGRFRPDREGEWSG